MTKYTKKKKPKEGVVHSTTLTGIPYKIRGRHTKSSSRKRKIIYKTKKTIQPRIHLSLQKTIKPKILDSPPMNEPPDKAIVLPSTTPSPFISPNHSSPSRPNVQVHFGERIGENLYSVQLLGQGGFGTVHRMRSDSGKTYALKIQPVSEYSKNEVKVLHLLAPECEKYTICFIHAYIKEEGAEIKEDPSMYEDPEQYKYLEMVGTTIPSSISYILMDELVGYISLSATHFQEFNPRLVARMLAGVCNAVHYIHSKGVAHLDIKPSNLLWHPQKEQIMLIDFGISIITPSEPNKKTLLPDVIGSPYYIDYITIYNNKSVGGLLASQIFSCDIWSIGVMLSLMLTGLHIWDYYNLKSPAAIYKYVVDKPNVPPNPIFNTNIYMIEQMLERNNLVIEIAKENNWSYADITECIQKKYQKRVLHIFGHESYASLEKIPTPIQSQVDKMSVSLSPKDIPASNARPSRNPFARTSTIANPFARKL